MSNETKITVEFNAEKISAMRMYMGAKDIQIETELVKTLENLYEKHVPSQVRDFILKKEDITPKKDKKPVRIVAQKFTNFDEGKTIPED